MAAIAEIERWSFTVCVCEIRGRFPMIFEKEREVERIVGFAPRSDGFRDSQ